MKSKDIYKSFSKVQEIIIDEIQQLDSSSKTNITKWKHNQGGGGLSCEISGKKTVWWFGGGFDLTPYFINKRDVLYWKNSAKTLCNKYNKGFYKKYNDNCNKYFFLPHRNEPLGIGGIFFDQLNNLDYDVCKSFALSCATTFIQS